MKNPRIDKDIEPSAPTGSGRHVFRSRKMVKRGEATKEKEKDKMSHPAIVPQSDFQRLVVEQALAYAQQLEQTARSAPPGQTLDSCETVVLDQGRQFLRDTLAAALQQQIHEGEKKGSRA